MLEYIIVVLHFKLSLFSCMSLIVKMIDVVLIVAMEATEMVCAFLMSVIIVIYVQNFPKLTCTR